MSVDGGGDEDELAPLEYRMPAARFLKKTSSEPGWHGKFCVDVVNPLLDLLRIGNFISTSCAAVGITSQSFYRWVDRGQKEIDRVLDGGEPDPDEAAYAEFTMKQAQARGLSEGEAVGRMFEMVQGRVRVGVDSWRVIDDRVSLDANRFFLERGFPDNWGRRHTKQAETNIRLEFVVEVAEPRVFGANDDEGEVIDVEPEGDGNP